MLSDRFGARPLATLGPLLAAVSFFLLARLPVDFPYVVFPLYRYVSDLKPGQITGQVGLGRHARFPRRCALRAPLRGNRPRTHHQPDRPPRNYTAACLDYAVPDP